MSDTTPPMPPAPDTDDDEVVVESEVEEETPEGAEVPDDSEATESSFKTDKSVEELAREVLQGQWGNGHDRHLRLAQAGYDHRAVQREVENQLKRNEG